MIRIKNNVDRIRIKKSSQINSSCFTHIKRFIKPGITTLELDKLIDKYIERQNAKASFKEVKKYKHSSTISINEEVIHGVPGTRTLNEGDVVSIDIGVNKDNYYSDAACTFLLGKENKKFDLIKTCYESLIAGINELVPGKKLNMVGKAIESYVTSKGYFLVKQFSGHGVGFDHHESPIVPNFYAENNEEIIKAGMVLAIEPVILESESEVYLSENGTYVAKNGSTAVHFEHTVYVSENGPEILTHWQI